MNNISEFTQCANCGACYNICPKDAIRVDSSGLFYRVTVDEDKCVGCGKCMQVCPLNTTESHQQLQSAHCTVHMDQNIVKCSSSGGAFSAMADWILRQGGAVFGACYSEDRTQVIFCSSDQVPLDELRRSKYVESQVGTAFRNVKAQLEQGRKILFCGTPCQVAGLLRYLGCENENLYTCDFSCGGLPSHAIYQDYLRDLQRRYGANVTDVNFRPKTLGWETYAITVNFTNGRSYESPAVLDPYFYAFVEKHYSVRDNCLNCHFADNHYADIILADFWKYQALTGKKNHSGVSLVIVNSWKGQQLFAAASRNMICRDLDLEDASYNMKRKIRSEAFLERRKAFLDRFQAEGLNDAKNCLEMPTGIKKLAVNCKSAIKKILWRVR